MTSEFEKFINDRSDLRRKYFETDGYSSGRILLTTQITNDAEMHVLFARLSPVLTKIGIVILLKL